MDIEEIVAQTLHSLPLFFKFLGVEFRSKNAVIVETFEFESLLEIEKI